MQLCFFSQQSQGFSPSGQFDENQVTFAPRGGRIWNARKNNSGSAMTRTGSGGAGPYSSSQRNEQQSGAARSSTPTMMNRFSALNSLPNHEQQPQNNASSRMAQGSSNSSRLVFASVFILLLIDYITGGILPRDFYIFYGSCLR